MMSVLQALAILNTGLQSMLKVATRNPEALSRSAGEETLRIMRKCVKNAKVFSCCYYRIYKSNINVKKKIEHDAPLASLF